MELDADLLTGKLDHAKSTKFVADLLQICQAWLPLFWSLIPALVEIQQHEDKFNPIKSLLFAEVKLFSRNFSRRVAVVCLLDGSCARVVGIERLALSLQPPPLQPATFPSSSRPRWMLPTRALARAHLGPRAFGCAPQ